jgi:hypothetical protein
MAWAVDGASNCCASGGYHIYVMWAWAGLLQVEKSSDDTVKLKILQTALTLLQNPHNVDDKVCQHGQHLKQCSVFGCTTPAADCSWHGVPAMTALAAVIRLIWSTKQPALWFVIVGIAAVMCLQHTAAGMVQCTWPTRCPARFR